MIKKIIYSLFGLIVVLVVVVVGIKTDFFGLRKGGSVAGVSQASGYSAVFLSNGQVYFGKITEVSADWLKIKDIYYLQVEQKLQPKQEGDTTTEETTEVQQPKLSLVKLGNELHGPKDEMIINTKHVIFYEDLKDEGKVVQSINKYLEEKANK